MRLTKPAAWIAVSAAVLVLAGPAAAETAPKKDKPASGLGNLGGGGKEPIKIDADRLDVFDRENKAIFAGNVVAVQGDSTIRCSTMTVRYKRAKDAKSDTKGDAKSDKGEAAKDGADDAKAAPEKTPAAMGENGIQRVECAGPVTVVQKDQVATGDNAVFDQEAKRIVLTGNVVLSQCQNVTRGSRLVYDMNTGRANMDPVAGGRVSALFVPQKEGEAKGAGKGCAQPAAAAKAAPKPSDAKPSDTKPSEAVGDKPAAKPRAQAN
ncbi:organic solvent tolerance protein OstA [Methylobacterium sp. BTF04]|uniref:LptA/OstA family protein n=1 Tax=Methylobacterium sp. BTF04 TaxID=2708300 RepID=UPI0013D79C09|nr:LptA/OstA family protein [Methylobacterium sp. BTF04]NEU10774.1 organic solvent tolerance protein OstA [Methylobacterium sp. BTF04]